MRHGGLSQGAGPPALEKRKRLLAQIDYASKDKDCFEKLEKFILNIKDDEWYYGDEPPSDETPSMI